MSTTSTHTNSTDAYEGWPIGALEPAILDLQAALSILGHLINSPDAVDKNTWHSVEDDLNDAAGVIKQLWRQTWDRQLVERREHEAALAAAKAHKAAPGSPADIALALSLWRTMRVMAKATLEACDEGELVRAQIGFVDRGD